MMVLKNIVKFVGISAFALFLGACTTTKTQESTGQFIDNSAITAKVKSVFVNDKLVKGRQINVKSYKGIVQLSGFVNSQAEANRAANLARGVEGVVSVKNHLIVK